MRAPGDRPCRGLLSAQSVAPAARRGPLGTDDRVVANTIAPGGGLCVTKRSRESGLPAGLRGLLIAYSRDAILPNQTVHQADVDKVIVPAARQSSPDVFSSGFRAIRRPPRR
jgi:hypothetical protein